MENFGNTVYTYVDEQHEVGLGDAPMSIANSQRHRSTVEVSGVCYHAKNLTRFLFVSGETVCRQ